MKRIGTLLASLLVLGVVAGSAQARSVPAMTGAALYGKYSACFNVNNSNGAVLYLTDPTFCAGGGIRYYEVPAILDSFGTKSLTLTVSAPDSTTSCRGVGIGKNGSGISVSPNYTASVLNTPVDLTTMNVVVPASGSAYVDCQVGPSASLIVLNNS